MDLKVKGHPNLIKRGSGVINNDSSEYQRALVRLQQGRRAKDLENRLSRLEGMVEKMLDLMENRANGN